MPEGIRPRVNEVREFLEIAKDFKDPKEIIREALSNSWDAGASKTSLKFNLAPHPGTRKKKIVVEITDDGEGMVLLRFKYTTCKTRTAIPTPPEPFHPRSNQTGTRPISTWITRSSANGSKMPQRQPASDERSGR